MNNLNEEIQLQLFSKGKDPNSKKANRKVKKNSNRELIKNVLRTNKVLTERQIFNELHKYYPIKFESKSDVTRRVSEMLHDGTLIKVSNVEERGSTVRAVRLNKVC